MLLIVFLYMLLASSFTAGKAMLGYMSPFLFVAVRMMAAGAILFAYQLVRCRWHTFAIKKEHYLLVMQLIAFHIYGSYVLEYWAMQFMSSSKAALLYSFSPWISALFAYVLFKERMNFKKKLGLFVGFVGLLPILIEHDPSERCVGEVSFLSFAEIGLLLSVVSAAYGWTVMRQLVREHHYSPVSMNAIAMIFGGLGAFITSLLVEGSPTICVSAATDIGCITRVCSPFVSAHVAMAVFYLMCLIITTNFIFYNLYGYLLRLYSTTFLSFTGFLCPVFAALFGWLWLGETITYHYYITMVLVVVGLYIFYQEELTDIKQTR